MRTARSAIAITWIADARPPLGYHTTTDPPARPRCAACGSDRTIVGTLAGDVGFKPTALRKFFHPTGTVRVDAIACAACGHISLGVNAGKLIDLAGEPAMAKKRLLTPFPFS